MGITTSLSGSGIRGWGTRCMRRSKTAGARAAAKDSQVSKCWIVCVCCCISDVGFS